MTCTTCGGKGVGAERPRSSLLDRATGVKSFLVRRIPELAIIAFGIGLRFLMLRYDPRQSYDANDHWPYIEWFRTHWSLPPLMLCRGPFHPPLFYLF